MIGRTFLRRLRRDRRGTSAIEFAMIGPLLAVVAIGITDLARGLSRKYELEQASYRALELVTVGSLVQAPMASDYAYVKTEAAAAAGVPEANVTVVPWLECNGTVQPFASPCPNSAHQTARFLTVTIRDRYQPMFAYGPLGQSFVGAVDGKIPLTARSTIRMQ